jgi:hypothetical protein
MKWSYKKSIKLKLRVRGSSASPQTNKNSRIYKERYFLLWKYHRLKKYLMFAFTWNIGKKGLIMMLYQNNEVKN